MEQRVHYNIIVVGAGGTGGNLLKELGRFLKFFKGKESWSLSIYDGDIVEEKNGERQPFTTEDVFQHKASIMAEGMVDCLGLPRESVKAYPRYLDTIDDIEKYQGYGVKTIDVLIGCVDNHRARQVLHKFFYGQKNCVYIDSANEFAEGEIVVGIRINGKTVAPPRGFYFPEVLKSRGKRASEISCGAVNKSAPQHLITNLAAAGHVLSFVVQLMQGHKLEGGILYFNAFTHYCRFDRWSEQVQKRFEADGRMVEQ